MNYLKSCILILAALLFAKVEGGYVVIINEEITADSISQQELKNIYLGKKTRWDNDTPIHPVVMRRGAIHDQFLQNTVQKTSSQFNIYWKRVIFTGKGLPFERMGDEEELIEYVRTTEGAIGYVSEEATIGEGVKKIRIN